MNRGRKRKFIEIENVTLRTSTAGAGLFCLEGGEEHWIPWTQVDENSVDRDGETGTLIVTEWWATEKMRLDID